MKQKHSLLLITDYPPTTPGGGAVILRSLLKTEDSVKVTWLGLFGSEDCVANQPLGQKTFRHRLLAKYPYLLGSTLLARYLAQRILEIAKQNQIDGLWLVMHGCSVNVGAHLARTCQLPIHVTVHDDPVCYTKMSRKFFWLAPLVKKDFQDCLKQARSVDVVSEPMAAMYNKQYGVESIIVHRGISSNISTDILQTNGIVDLSIGILGSHYGNDSLPFLCEALILAATQLGCRARLLLIGQHCSQGLQEKFGTRLHIEIDRFKSEEAAVERLRHCALLYISYPFSVKNVVFRQTSFPTKLSTYVMAARPLLMHVPNDSSVMVLTNESHYVFAWENLIISEGARIIREFWTKNSPERDFSTDAERVRQRYYDFNTNHNRLFAKLEQLFVTSIE